MTILIDIIGPVFGLIAFGYAAAFTPVFDKAAAKGLANFVFFFALPVMLFRSIGTTELPETINFSYLLSYFSGVAITGFLTAFAVRAAGIRQFDHRVIIGFGASYGNTVLLGIPLVLTAFGDAAGLPLFLLMSVHGLTFFTAVTILIESHRGGSAEVRALPGRVLKGLLTNTILLGLLSGVLFNLSGLTLPAAIDSWAEFIGRAALPCALFSMGASLREYRLVGAVPLSTAISLVKLVLQPLLVFLIATHLFDVPPLWTKVAVVCAAMPTGVNVYLFAVRYRCGEAEIASAIILSTALSVLTVTGILTFLMN